MTFETLDNLEHFNEPFRKSLLQKTEDKVNYKIQLSYDLFM